MTQEEIQQCQKDLRHRRWGFYYCKEDPRVIVPKRIKWMGWTLNMARPSAIPIGLFLMGICVVPALFAQKSGFGTGLIIVTAGISLTLLCLICALFSSTKR